MTGGRAADRGRRTPRRIFIDSVHVEQNLFSYTDGFHDPESDFWLWDYVHRR